MAYMRKRLEFHRFLLILMTGSLTRGAIAMRTLILIASLSLSSLAAAEGRAPTEQEMQELDIIQQSWIFQG